MTEALNEFVPKASGNIGEGKATRHEELDGLNKSLGYLLPEWFIKIYSTFPLAGCLLDYPQYDTNNNFDECITIQFARLEDIYNEMELAYPRCAVKPLGYFCFAIDAAGSGDQYYMSNKQGDNPPVFQVLHDVSDVGEEIERRGMIKIADAFSDFIKNARIDV